MSAMVLAEYFKRHPVTPPAPPGGAMSSSDDEASETIADEFDDAPAGGCAPISEKRMGDDAAGQETASV